MISLNWLINGLAAPLAEDIQVAAISMDSRDVLPGSLFIATAKQADVRQRHIDEAISAGASSIMVDAGHEADSSVPLLQIADLDQQISAIGNRFYGEPSKSGINRQTLRCYWHSGYWPAQRFT